MVEDRAIAEAIQAVAEPSPELIAAARSVGAAKAIAVHRELSKGYREASRQNRDDSLLWLSASVTAAIAGLVLMSERNPVRYAGLGLVAIAGITAAAAKPSGTAEPSMALPAMGAPVNLPSAGRAVSGDLGKIVEATHVLIAGPSGAGKSTLARAIAAATPAQVLVIDPHAAPGDWQGFQVIGGGRSYDAIADALRGLLAEMDKRYKDRDGGKKNFDKLCVIVDEWPAIAASEQCKDIAPEALKKLGREARKVGMQMIVLVQGTEVKAMGLEGEGSLRQAFSVVRLGKFALEYAAKLKNPELTETVRKQARPCMVDDEPFNLPKLG